MNVERTREAMSMEKGSDMRINYPFAIEFCARMSF